MKASELAGPLLDCWVARSEGLDPHMIDGQWKVSATDEQRVIAQSKWVTIKRYSEVWDFGGPIIDRWEEVSFSRFDGITQCFLGREGIHTGANTKFGETKLMAAMRTYVATKFGEELPDMDAKSAANKEVKG